MPANLVEGMCCALRKGDDREKMKGFFALLDPSRAATSRVVAMDMPAPFYV